MFSSSLLFFGSLVDYVSLRSFTFSFRTTSRSGVSRVGPIPRHKERRSCTCDARSLVRRGSRASPFSTLESTQACGAAVSVSDCGSASEIDRFVISLLHLSQTTSTLSPRFTNNFFVSTAYLSDFYSQIHDLGTVTTWLSEPHIVQRG